MPARPYRSHLRAEQARGTRRTLVLAAHHLFVERGYEGTTIDAVAERAGVSRKTVFAAVGGKAELLKLAWDWALVGDDEPVPMAQRAEVPAMLAETDAARLVHTWTRFIVPITRRLAPLYPVLVAAARSDPEIAALNEVSERNLLGGARQFVGNLARLGCLRPDWSVERASQVVTTLMDPMAFDRLVTRSGWSEDEFADWLVVLVLGTLVTLRAAAANSGPVAGPEGAPITP